MRRAHWTAPVWASCLIGLLAIASAFAAPDTTSVEGLRSRHADLGATLANNQFRRPLVIESAESSSQSKGEVYAVLDHPFALVNKALNDPSHWCDILILHLNTKYCRESRTGTGSLLRVSVGRKFFQPIEDAHALEFVYSAVTTTPEYFDILLNAREGPMGTSDYHIRMEAVSVAGGKTFLHLTYAYAYNFVGRVAMQGYLATLGSGKLGFTVIGKTSDGQAEYIAGVRGAVERNTMRYFLAIDTYLATLSAAPSEQIEKRLQAWFAATELYPRQLHEVDRAEYLDMKRREILRQQKPL